MLFRCEDVFTMCVVSYFSVAGLEYHDQGTLQRVGFIGAFSSRRRIYNGGRGPAVGLGVGG